MAGATASGMRANRLMTSVPTQAATQVAQMMLFLNSLTHAFQPASSWKRQPAPYSA